VLSICIDYNLESNESQNPTRSAKSISKLTRTLKVDIDDSGALWSKCIVSNTWKHVRVVQVSDKWQIQCRDEQVNCELSDVSDRESGLLFQTNMIISKLV
jgi:hypothetical protein